MDISSSSSSSSSNEADLSPNYKKTRLINNTYRKKKRLTKKSHCNINLPINDISNQTRLNSFAEIEQVLILNIS